jgi:two-component system response regulator AtoC
MSANLSKTEHVAPGSLDHIELLISELRIDDAAQELKNYRSRRKANPSPVVQGWEHYLSARISLSRADYRTALALAKKSFEALRTTTENSKIGKILLLLAKVSLALGGMEETESYTRDALAAFRRIRDRAGIFSCYNKLAYVHFVRGNYEKSAKYLQRTIDSLREHATDNEKAAISLARYSANLARVYILTGDWDEAADLLEVCIEKNRQYGIKRSLILNYLSLGYLSTLKRSQRHAWYCLEEVRHLIEKGPQFLREAVILKEYLGKYYTEFGEPEKAVKVLSAGLIEADQIAPDSALTSQLCRLRAEAFLSLGKFEEALADARRSLSVAEKLGEKVEIAHSLRIAGIAEVRRGEQKRGVRFLHKSEETFSGLGDKYEKARALLDFATDGFIHDSEYDYRRAQAHIVTARFTFEELENRYYLAETWMVEAALHERYGKYDLALKAVEEAESLFGTLGEIDRTRMARAMRQALESKLVDHALSPQNEFLLFKEYLSDNEYKNVRQGTLTANLDVLTRRIGADCAIVAISNPADSGFKVLASVRLEEDRARNVLRQVQPSDISELNGRPVFASAPDFAGVNGFSNLIDQFPEATSIMLLPLRISDRETGMLLLMRDAASLGGKFFGQRDLNFAVAFSDVVAFKAIEEEQQELVEDNRRLRQQLGEKCAFPNIVTRDEAMLRMLDRVVQVKDSPISILIEGETGSGKDLIARALHYNSIRAGKRFISVNCAALPETLLESELFGYKRGAFTGADRDKAGLFEEADGGTFFLDEIGEMPLSIQVKLLRVLEDQEVVRLGETSGRKVDVRVLSATNRDLKAAMAKGEFRQDLYYRLSALTLKIPPLRDRRPDIPLLIDHFMEKSERQIGFDPEVARKLIEYSWPGNVRELENEIRKLVLLCDSSGVVDAALLSRKFTRDQSASEAPDIPELDISADGFSLYSYIEEFEKKYLTKALSQHNWVKKHAAAALKIPESTLRLKIKQYGIQKP